MKKSFQVAIVVLAGLVLIGIAGYASALSAPATGTPTPAGTPLHAEAVLQPTPKPTEAVPGNLLANPSFEGQYTTWPGTGNVNVPPDWTPWWNTGPNDHRPEYVESNLIDWYRVHSGIKAQKYFNFWSTTTGAGLYQRVNATPGSLLEARAWVHAWSGYWCPDTPGFYDAIGRPTSLWRDNGKGVPCTHDLDPNNITVRVGIDPYGGTDPNSSNVVWNPESDWYGHYDIYAHSQPVQTYAHAVSVTLFLRSQVLWGFRVNDVYWDDASLVVVGPSAEFSSIQPAQPELGQLTTVKVRSNAALPNARISITDPLSIPVTHTIAILSGSGPYTWTWYFTPTQIPGTYTLAFSADTLPASVTTTMRAIATARLTAHPSTAWLSQTVTVYAKSYRRYDSTQLTITTPSGSAITPVNIGIIHGPNIITREWQFASTVTGTHLIQHDDALFETPISTSVNVVSVVGVSSSPPAPPISTPVTLQMWAYYPYSNIALALTDPQGLPVTPDYLGQSAPSAFIWQWRFTPTITGTFHYTVTANRLDAPAYGMVFVGGQAVYLPIVTK